MWNCGLTKTRRNLPNIPLPNQGNLKNGQTSSTYVGDRSTDRIPATVSAALLELHYVCLVEAKAFGLINPSGSVLSSVGGRVTLVDILSMADLAGYTARILTLSWKEQSEPESVIGGYADQEEKSGREVSVANSPQYPSLYPSYTVLKARGIT
jgi:hypothetical protein